MARADFVEHEAFGVVELIGVSVGCVEANLDTLPRLDQHSVQFDVPGRYPGHGSNGGVETKELVEVSPNPGRIAKPVLETGFLGGPVRDVADRRTGGVQPAQGENAQAADLLVVSDRPAVQLCVDESCQDSVAGDSS
jgi:hypothetical protein